MSAPESPISMPGSLSGETLIRALLRGLTKAQRMDIMEATGWKDESSISQIISGTQGIKLDHLDAIMRVLDLSIQEGWYMAYLRNGNTIGANCCRASASMGGCRPR